MKLFNRGAKTMDEDAIVLGETYRDTVSGWEGKVVSTHKYMHGCTRVTMQKRVGDELKDYSFDVLQLEKVDTGEAVTSRRSGGVQPTPAQPAAPAR